MTTSIPIYDETFDIKRSLLIENFFCNHFDSFLRFVHLTFRINSRNTFMAVHGQPVHYFKIGDFEVISHAKEPVSPNTVEKDSQVDSFLVDFYDNYDIGKIIALEFTFPDFRNKQCIVDLPARFSFEEDEGKYIFELDMSKYLKKWHSLDLYAKKQMFLGIL